MPAGRQRARGRTPSRERRGRGQQSVFAFITVVLLLGVAVPAFSVADTMAGHPDTVINESVTAANDTDVRVDRQADSYQPSVTVRADLNGEAVELDRREDYRWYRREGRLHWQNTTAVRDATNVTITYTALVRYQPTRNVAGLLTAFTGVLALVGLYRGYRTTVDLAIGDDDA